SMRTFEASTCRWSLPPFPSSNPPTNAKTSGENPMLKFTPEHEWLKLDGDVATVGITIHAAEQLGDLVFVELPEVGANLTKDGDGATVESVKAASDVYCPLDGEETKIHQAIVDDPSI